MTSFARPSGNAISLMLGSAPGDSPEIAMAQELQRIQRGAREGGRLLSFTPSSSSSSSSSS